MSELLTYCTGHREHSVPLSLGGNASQKERSPQEARHSETWSSGFHCVGYPVGSLQLEPLFNPSETWCTQCHPVCSLGGSTCRNCLCLCAWMDLLCRNATFGNLCNSGFPKRKETKVRTSICAMFLSITEVLGKYLHRWCNILMQKMSCKHVLS